MTEAGLRRLAAQITAGKVTVKLHLRHSLHAKLYLLLRHDPVSPSVGFLGSSNPTFAGLSKQGELIIGQSWASPDAIPPHRVYVLLGDVVGLGKTLMATALARIMACVRFARPARP